MKQSIAYQYNQANLLKIWEVETQRLNHLKRLNTIYREKSKTRKEKSLTSNDNSTFNALHLKNKEVDTVRKYRNIQDKINYENQILRNKLLDASIPDKFKARATQINYKTNYATENQKSKEKKIAFSPQKRENYFSQSYLKKQQKVKIAQENAKIFVKLATMKSDVMQKLNIKSHKQKTQELKQKLQRRSPRRLKMLRTFFQKRNLQIGQIHFPNHLENYQKVEIENAQEID